MFKKWLWLLSTLITAVLILMITFSLYRANNNYEHASFQLATPAKVQAFLAHNYNSYFSHIAKPTYIPTGIFLESLDFRQHDIVHLSGYIWQLFTKDFPDQLSRGVNFPDAIDITQKKAYERQQHGNTVIGWYFEGNFSQDFFFQRYPFDTKKIEVRLRSKDFDKNVILVPHLAAYDSTKTTDKFGLDPEILLAGYTPLETFFYYRLSDYDSNFGIKHYIGQKNFPELYFNIILKRHVLGAFVVNVFPLLVVLFLSFGLLLIITARERKLKFFGFDLSDSLRICAVLLFVILLAHIQLHNQFLNSDLVYLEYLYFVLYAGLLYVGINAFLLIKYQRRDWFYHLLHYEDNIIPKILYLPLVFSSILVISYLQL